MSSTVELKGFVAVLTNAILDQKEREDVNEILNDQKAGLSINYEGTMVYSSKADEDYHGLFIGRIPAAKPNTQPFIDSCSENGIEIDVDSIRPFQEIYYNGGDSGIDMLSLESFLGGSG